MKRKKVLPLTKEELKSHQDSRNCYICRKMILKKLSKNLVRDSLKVRDRFHYTGKYRGAGHSICNSKFNMSDEISVVFHDVSNYDYHFIIKELAYEFVRKFECLGENTEKCKAFLVPISYKADKDGNESVITISSKKKFIDSARIMASHYQILLIISQKEFTKLNVKIAIVFLNIKVSKEIQ